MVTNSVLCTTFKSSSCRDLGTEEVISSRDSQLIKTGIEFHNDTFQYDDDFKNLLLKRDLTRPMSEVAEQM